MGGTRQILIDEAHKSKFSIHPGATKMYLDLRHSYWWPCMKRDISWFVERCLTCRKVKVEHQICHDNLQPLEVPLWKWESITMDFITKLPKMTKSFDTIWVTMDRLTNSAHFLAIHGSSSTKNWLRSMFGRWLLVMVYPVLSFWTRMSVSLPDFGRSFMRR